MLLGVAAEHLIDRVLKVGPADAILAVKQLCLLGVIVAQAGTVITMPDRTEPASRCADAKLVAVAADRGRVLDLRGQPDAEWSLSESSADRAGAPRSLGSKSLAGAETR
jgi:hypothetical protein